MSSGRAFNPREAHQWISASSWPWVTQISPAPVAAMVAVSPSQSAWSEITSGNATPCWRARGRTRHPPQAQTGNGGGKSGGPKSVKAARGQEDRDRAGEIGLGGAAREPQLAKRNAALSVVVCDFLHRAVQIDWRLVARFSQERDQALRLADRIGADEVRTFGKQRNRMQ